MTLLKQQPIAAERVLEAYAKSLAVYEAAEKAFKDEPTPETLVAHLRAIDRYNALRNEVSRNIVFSDALLGTEADESVGR